MNRHVNAIAARLQPAPAATALVGDQIRSGPWEPAELGRMECRKTFPFNREWNKRRYATKEVRPIFVEEADEIVVVTVYYS